MHGMSAQNVAHNNCWHFNR